MERAGKLAGKLKITHGLADADVRARSAWKAAAGKKIAEHTRAVSLVRGKLVVEVDDAVWQRQLNTLRHFLLRNLAREIGEELVTDLDFRPVPKRRGPQAEVQARPAKLNDDAQQILDPFLRGLYRETEAKLRKQG
jgi:predicted nucleic acid-binding Zn ribbon protein